MEVYVASVCYICLDFNACIAPLTNVTGQFTY